MEEKDNSKIDYKTYCIPPLQLIELKRDQRILYDTIHHRIQLIVNGSKYANHKFYIGKTNDCNRRIKEHERDRNVEKMFVIVDDCGTSDFIGKLERDFICAYKEHHPNCSNTDNGESSLRFLYIVIWEN